jgi:ribosomal protein L6P/L9E
LWRELIIPEGVTNTWFGIYIICDGPVGQPLKKVLADTKIKIEKNKKIIKTGEESKDFSESFARYLRYIEWRHF